MPKTEIIINTKRLVVFFLMSFIFIVAVIKYASWVTTKNPSAVSTPSPIPTSFKSVECPPTFEDYQRIKDTTAQTVSLVNDPFSSYGKGSFRYRGVVVTKIETDKAKVACGYIFIRSSTDRSGLKEWENVYINPNEFGGHLGRNNQFGPGDGQNYSDYVFSLNNINYWPKRDDTAIRTADWASLLNVSGNVTFEIALNTTNPTGKIESVSLTYKCWNPKTGEENKDCKIMVEKIVDSQKSL